jgi:vacuolar-type H+-ATPase subunit E/Vma4
MAKNKKDTDQPQNEEKPVEQPNPKQSYISAKNFAKKLRLELKEKNISETVFVAFERTVKSIDSEENFRKVWKSTFYRS